MPPKPKSQQGAQLSTAEFNGADVKGFPLKTIRNPPSHPHELSSFCDNNLLTEKVIPVPSITRAKELLNYNGMPAPAEKKQTLGEQRTMRLNALSKAYVATNQQADYLAQTIATIRHSLLLRDPHHPRYLRFFHGQYHQLNSVEPVMRPDFLASLEGPASIIVGPTGGGKSAFIQRLRFILGSHTHVSTSPESGGLELTFIPILVVRWPKCRTLEGLLVNLKDAINSETGREYLAFSRFGAMNTRGQMQLVTSACIAMHVGLIVMDGGCTSTIRFEYERIFEFLASLKDYTGIPIIVTCTYPVFQKLTQSGSIGRSICNTKPLYCDYLANSEQWDYFVSAFWRLGKHDFSEPEYLPSLLHRTCLGSPAFLCQAMQELHGKLYKIPNLKNIDGIEVNVERIVQNRLKPFQVPISFIRTHLEKKRINPVDLRNYGDYLPFDLFNSPIDGPY